MEGGGGTPATPVNLTGKGHTGEIRGVCVCGNFLIKAIFEKK